MACHISSKFTSCETERKFSKETSAKGLTLVLALAIPRQLSCCKIFTWICQKHT